MPEFSSEIVQLVSRAAKGQGGIIDGENPAAFNDTDPLRLWIIQVGIILIFVHLLAMIGSRIRQPRVIAEVIGGVILGPTVMGRIPGFSKNIFPKESLPYLNLTSTIGLVLFLFLVGLEVDVRIIKKNIKSSTAISVAGMVLPFGIAAAIAVPIYNEFVNHSKVSLAHFILFQSVAISITAFPVLCRILTETKLLDTTVGVVVLAAGVGNDVVGWILLALTVALVNASGGLTALWVLMACVAWVLFLLIPVKRAFYWLAKRTGSLENGPSSFMMTVTLLIVFISAFFTDIIGVHAIFGGFLAGLIIPKEGGFAITLVEKLEDLVVILLLPIYFTLSGLKTNLGLLNDGITWGYTILIIVVAFVGKFVGCAAAAKVSGFDVRESGAIGALMSCKGLVELIVLNIGLQAGILDTRLFSMFVVMAIVLTFITTPLTLWIYPASVRKTNSGLLPTATRSDGEKQSYNTSERSSIDEWDRPKSRFAVILERIEHLPSLMTFVQLLQTPLTPAPAPVSEKEREATSNTPLHAPSRPVTIDALRLIELTERTSAVMRGSETGELIKRDSLINVFQMFGRLNRIPVSNSLSVTPYDTFASSVSEHASHARADLIVLPWTAGAHVPTAGSLFPESTSTAPQAAHSYNPFEALFGKGATPGHTITNTADSSIFYSQFIRHVFAQAPADVALLVDRGNTFDVSSVSVTSGQHLFLPFFGGPDDRLALSVVLQIVRSNAGVSATIVRFTKAEADWDLGSADAPTRDSIDAAKAAHGFTINTQSGFPDTVYGHATTEHRLTSNTADQLAWSKLTSNETIATLSTRLTVDEITTPQPLHALVQRLSTLASSTSNVLVVTGRARRLAVESHEKELKAYAIEMHAANGGPNVAEVRKTVGDVASVVVLATGLPLIVFQVSNPSLGEEAEL